MLPLLALPLWVQDDPMLDDSVVVAPRSELAVTTSAAETTVVSGEELVETGERSLPRALGRAAGVWIQESNLGGGAPVIRGLLGNQILIMLDGVRVNDSTTRFGPNQSLNTIDPAIVERVEITRGSSSVLYGSDAIGGVVSIWTKRRAPARTSGDEALHGGFELLHDTATEGWRGVDSLSGAGSCVGLYGLFSADDWHDLEAGEGEIQEATGYRSVTGFGSADFLIDDARSLRVMTLVHRDFDVPRTFSMVPGFGQDEPSFAKYFFTLQEREIGILTYDDAEPGVLADRMQLRLSARRYTEQRERRRLGSDTLVFGETEVATAGLGGDWTKAVGEGHLLKWGFDLDNDDVDSFNVETDLTSGDQTRTDGDFAADARYTSFGAFVQDEVLSLAPTYLTLGLRWSYYDFAFDGDADERVDGSFDDLTASVEAARDLSGDVRMTATLAQGFQAPNLEDLANDGDFAGGTELANPELDPAKSLMAEVALEVSRSAWSGTAAVFFTRIDDYIGRRLVDEGDPSQSGDEIYLRENAGRLNLWGAELGARRRLGGPSSPWSVEAQASWVRARQHDDTVDPNSDEAPLDGVEGRRIPPLNGYAALGWNDLGPDPEWLDEASLTLRWAARQDHLHPEDESDVRIDPDGTDGWTIWSLDFGGALSAGVRWHLSLVNLLDELYRVHGSGVDGPGRSAVIGVQATF